MIEERTLSLSSLTGFTKTCADLFLRKTNFCSPSWFAWRLWMKYFKNKVV